RRRRARGPGRLASWCLLRRASHFSPVAACRLPIAAEGHTGYGPRGSDERGKKGLRMRDRVRGVPAMATTRVIAVLAAIVLLSTDAGGSPDVREILHRVLTVNADTPDVAS